jgi:UDP-N-acetylmuramyl pentapeptide phosphotransferase/UDP-N-acetylglucosamine-1-phosphate transferase
MVAGQGTVLGAVGLAVVAMGASAAATAAWIGWARRRDVVDQPGQRRLHATATPRGGGVGIAVVVLAVLAFRVLTTWTPAYPDSGRSVPLLIGVACAAITGLVDDLLAMPSSFKLAGQMLAAAAIAWALPWPAGAGLLGHALAFAWVLVLVNFWNFMDGANGIVAVQTVVVAGALAGMLGGPGAMLGLTVAAACLGFLPFNLPKARVFMGDTGSHVLGAMVAILTLWALREGKANPAQVFILLSAFLLDAGLTLGKRIVQGRRFWRAHREHLYQWAVRRGHAHAPVCLAYAAWAILCAWVAFGWGARGATEAVVAALAVGLAGATTWFVLRRHWLRRDTRMDART